MGEYEQAAMDKRVGAVDHLREVIENIHGEIGRITDALAPVLSPSEPSTALDSVGSPAADIQHVHARALEAHERLIRLRDRLVI